MVKDQQVGFVTPLSGSEASSIRVAEYLTELPPREVLEKKLEGSGGDAQRAARCYAGGEMKETVPTGMWRMKGASE